MEYWHTVILEELGTIGNHYVVVLVVLSGGKLKCALLLYVFL